MNFIHKDCSFHIFIASQTLVLSIFCLKFPLFLKTVSELKLDARARIFVGVSRALPDHNNQMIT